MVTLLDYPLFLTILHQQVNPWILSDNDIKSEMIIEIIKTN